MKPLLLYETITKLMNNTKTICRKGETVMEKEKKLKLHQAVCSAMGAWQQGENGEIQVDNGNISNLINDIADDIEDFCCSLNTDIKLKDIVGIIKTSQIVKINNHDTGEEYCPSYRDLTVYKDYYVTEINADDKKLIITIMSQI